MVSNNESVTNLRITNKSSSRKNSRIRIFVFNSLFVTISLLFLVQHCFAQANISTPYSRYAIGDLQSDGFARNLGMGGLAIGMNSPYSVNYANPASYASLGLTTFEGGIQGNLTSLSASGVSATSASTSFSYFAFGFPIKSGKWGLSFGLLPFSSANYNITDVEPNADLGSVKYTYQGSGEINQFYAGTGYSLFKNLRLGVNAAYLFGTTDQVRIVAVPDNVYYFNTRITDATQVNDFHFKFGLQYTLDSLKFSPTDSIIFYRKHINALHESVKTLKDSLTQYEKRLSNPAASAEQLKVTIAAAKDSIASLNRQIGEQNKLKSQVVHSRRRGDWSFNFGANLSLATNINASKSSLTELFTYTSDGFVTIKDTAQNIALQSGVIQLPLFAGFGFTMKKGAKWLFGADVSIQNWSTYRSFGLSDSLVNSIQYTAGLQYTPNERSISSYSQIIQYRLGFHYNQTYLDLKNTKLNDYGVSIGFGLPMRRTLTIVHFAFEVGKMGTLVNQLVEVNYFRFTLGLSMSDIWFLKPRID